MRASTFALLLPVLFASACNTPTPRPEVGRAQMALTGTGSTGTIYRLRSAVFAITGVQSATLDTEDDPSRPSINVVLRVGAYLALLQPGWHMERQAPGGLFAPVNATLVSANPLGFSIEDQSTTQVRFRFNAGDDIVELGHGVASFSIEVNDCFGGACGEDRDGDGVPAPQDCNDEDPGMFPGNLESCDGRDNDCDGEVDDDDVCAGGCSLLDQTGCGAGEACYLEPAQVVTQCLPPGALQPGDSCGSAVNACASGDLCFDFGTGSGALCYEWCDLANPSCVQPGHACFEAGVQPGLGICFPL